MKAGPRNWTASAWWLERKYKDEFAKEIKQHEGQMVLGYGELEEQEAKTPEKARRMAAAAAL